VTYKKRIGYSPQFPPLYCKFGVSQRNKVEPTRFEIFDDFHCWINKWHQVLVSILATLQSDYCHFKPGNRLLIRHFLIDSYENIKLLKCLLE
jgi:hypothetical protein